MTTIDNNKVVNEEAKYICNNCNYTTTRIFDYNKHQTTIKHKKNTDMLQNNVQSKYKCEDCNKEYKHHSSLWKHKLTCKLSSENLEQKLLKENQEIKEMLLQQSKLLQELSMKINNNILIK